MKKLISIFTALIIAVAPALAWVDDAHSFAMEAAAPYVKQGFAVRQEFWGGTQNARQPGIIRHQLFKGNTYWFWLATDDEKATVTVHAYDPAGVLCDAEAWQKGKAAAVKVVPKKTGTYHLVVTIEESPKKRTRWVLAYGFK